MSLKPILFAGGYEGKILSLEFDPTASPPTLVVLSSVDDAGAAPTWLVPSVDG